MGASKAPFEFKWVRKMTKKTLAKEIALYESKKEELLKDYEGQYIAIKGSDIIGIFDTEKKAMREAYKKHGYVSLLVRKISEKEPTVYLKGVNIPWVLYP